ncbi:hypothetical protein AKJ42_00735 [candidate division MSBL1 archaeon SCGC-AAA261C02]|uniref:VapB-type antitoxin n=1 Tax=candidate division MSBL1 archaeon SCGC-AAA261C02 TaxID=1698272 RepID=A0A133V1W9_9EURY|nr:hypothetical protein AKJ42_00735 [candidate division MSBL1 archaeon SCGC-AAA261C02]
MGNTTIQVKKENLRLLNILKKEIGAKSYNEALEELLAKEFEITKDMFGVDRERISSFKEADRLEDRNASF